MNEQSYEELILMIDSESLKERLESLIKPYLSLIERRESLIKLYLSLIKP